MAPSAPTPCWLASRPRDELHEAFVVLVAEIARAVPTVDEDGCSGVGLVPVADHHVRAADGELAHLAPGHGAVGADDLDVDAGGGTTARAGVTILELALL